MEVEQVWRENQTGEEHKKTGGSHEAFQAEVLFEEVLQKCLFESSFQVNEGEEVKCLIK